MPSNPTTLTELVEDKSATMTIALTRGQVAIIDVADFGLVGHLKWHACSQRGSTSIWYAYAHRARGSAKLMMHRVIMDAKPGQIVDHINGNTLDNRRSNLRFVTNAENLSNRAGLDRNNKSGFRGVHFDKRDRPKPWVASCHIMGKYVCVGYFKTVEEAHKAVSAYRREHMPGALS